ncbi:MAG: dihydropteroate synthase [Acidobacteriota bacterium]
MIIIGERLNSSRKEVLEALKSKDKEFILKESKQQKEKGAEFIDLNASLLMEKELETLKWAIPIIEKEAGIPVSIDSSDVKVLEKSLEIHQGKAILNSLTIESKKIKYLSGIIKEKKPYIIGLLIDKDGMPNSPEEAYRKTLNFLEIIKHEGIDESEIFIDPLVRPIATNSNIANIFFESLIKIKKSIPELKTVAGISNVSFGLPRRKLINRIFLTISIFNGLDAAILDPLDDEIISTIFSVEALLGKDKNLKNYLLFCRKLKNQY